MRGCASEPRHISPQEGQSRQLRLLRSREKRSNLASASASPLSSRAWSAADALAQQPPSPSDGQFVSTCPSSTRPRRYRARQSRQKRWRHAAAPLPPPVRRSVDSSSTFSRQMPQNTVSRAPPSPKERLARLMSEPRLPASLQALAATRSISRRPPALGARPASTSQSDIHRPAEAPLPARRARLPLAPRERPAADAPAPARRNSVSQEKKQSVPRLWGSRRGPPAFFPFFRADPRAAEG